MNDTFRIIFEGDNHVIQLGWTAPFEQCNDWVQLYIASDFYLFKEFPRGRVCIKNEQTNQFVAIYDNLSGRKIM